MQAIFYHGQKILFNRDKNLKKTNYSYKDSSVTKTVETIGDIWTFLILGEAFFGIKSFEGFQTNLGIATNILSNRLKKLVKNEIMEKNQNPDDGRRYIYSLTEKGIDLYSISLTMMQWGDKWLSKEKKPPIILHHKKCGKKFYPVLCCSSCGEPINPRDVEHEIASIIK